MDTYDFPSRAPVTPVSGADPYLYAVWIRAALVNDSTPGSKVFIVNLTTCAYLNSSIY